jgi:hypothetical protein
MRGPTLSLVNLCVNSTSRPANLLRYCGLGFALILSACQKQEPEQSVENKVPPANTEPDNSKRQFEADVEKSKQNAVSRFPELGVAGSEMNTAFVKRVNQLKAANSSEFTDSNWPLVLAIQVESELKFVKEKAGLSGKQKMSTATRSLELRNFSVPELFQLKSLPFEEIRLSGVVTRVEKGVGSNLSGVVFIDNKIRCEFEISAVNYGSNSFSNTKQKIEINVRDGALLLLFRDTKTAQPLNERVIYKVGQVTSIVGRAAKKNLQTGIIAFKFELPPHLMP